MTKENLRDNMTTTELVLTMLGETSTKDISKAVKPEFFTENQEVAQRGGMVASVVRQALEAETGQPVITPQNAAQLNTVVVDIIEGTAEAVDEKSRKRSNQPEPTLWIGHKIKSEWLGKLKICVVFV